ncbi:GNAT family N-acetyltransferase [Aeromicrobium sp. CF4.19]|uniref:GNAT family N-acetyltransferase n=1 Tax=Aeromicrobium sp. CF4.19 TaxID=3373082 RepID=UPI003EE7F6FB
MGGLTPGPVRPARADDAAALRSVDAATWGSLTSPAPAPDPAAPHPFFSGERSPDGFLVAELEGAVVGYVGLHRTIPLASHAHVLTIDGLGVLPSACGRGVGRALVEAAVAAVALAAERGARRVTLRVLAPNESARRLYERCGFEVEGVLRGEFHLEGRDVDDVLMARTLQGE